MGIICILRKKRSGIKPGTVHSAISSTDSPIAVATLHLLFRRVGIQPSQLRQDRIFHEAAITADPVHLIRLFGVSPATAMHYVTAAHPERHGKRRVGRAWI